MIWFLGGQSSQRDVVRGAHEAIGGRAKVLASHRRDRPEITEFADVALREPPSRADRIDWIFEQAEAYDVKVVHAGNGSRTLEAARSRFEAAGRAVVTGASAPETFALLENKGDFARHAQQAGLPVIPGTPVTNAEEVAAALEEYAASESGVCIKPVQGIFGLGFWRIRPNADPFSALANADDRMLHPDLLLHAYAASAAPPTLLVMPYFPGTECSIDMVCEGGEVVAALSRRKVNGVQHLTREGPQVDLAMAAAHLYRCDGIVNAQTREDASGRPHLLEINLRPSGGITYTLVSGLNLPGIFATRRLGLPTPPDRWRGPLAVRPINTAVPV